MIISRKCQIPQINVGIKDNKLESCTSYKYLGIFIDKDLNWNTHIQYITKKVLKACGAMAKLRHCVDIDTLKNVYYSIVHSYVRYGLISWGTASSSMLSPLHTALHKVLRIMTFAPYGNIDLGPIYDFLNVLNLDQIFSFEVGKFCINLITIFYSYQALANTLNLTHLLICIHTPLEVKLQMLLPDLYATLN